MKRIPEDAFERYAALGPNRSYDTLATEYGVSRRSITKRAAKEKWQDRLREIDRKAQESTDAKLYESRDAMNERHLKLARFMQSKGVDTLRAAPIQTAADAIKAITAGIEKERLILGEPDKRAVVSIEEVTKREIATLLEVVEEDDDEADDQGQEVRAV